MTALASVMQAAAIHGSTAVATVQFKQIEALKAKVEQLTLEKTELKVTIKEMTCLTCCDRVRSGRCLCGNDACKVLCEGCLEADRLKGRCSYCTKKV